MKHMFNKLTDSGDILAADASTTVLSNIAVGFEELSGRALELAQLHNTLTNVRVTVRWSAVIPEAGYVYFEGKLYPIDWIRDPGVTSPDVRNGEVRRGLLLELYVHRSNDAKYTPLSNGIMLENGADALLLENGADVLILEA